MDDRKPAEFSDEHKLRFEFYKHLTTLGVAMAVLMATLIDKTTIARPLVGRAAIVVFVVSTVAAFTHMILLSHMLFEFQQRPRFNETMLGISTKWWAMASISLFILGFLLMLFAIG